MCFGTAKTLQFLHFDFYILYLSAERQRGAKGRVRRLYTGTKRYTEDMAQPILLACEINQWINL